MQNLLQTQVESVQSDADTQKRLLGKLQPGLCRRTRERTVTQIAEYGSNEDGDRQGAHAEPRKRRYACQQKR
jgi:hypothetical protein